MGLLSILGGPVKGLVKEIGGVIDSVTTTEEEKLKAQRKLVEIQQSFQVQIANVETEWAKAQRDTIVAEAKGDSWLQRSWRPIVMLFFAVIIGVVVFSGGYLNGRQLDTAFVMEILSIIKVGLGGYVIGRSAEKIVPGVAEIFAKKTESSKE